MALLFSHVKVQADGNEMNFFVCGVPTTASDLDNYTVYQEFLDELDGKTDIDIKVKSYLYGEGEVLEANIYEVAYFTISNGTVTVPQVLITIVSKVLSRGIFQCLPMSHLISMFSHCNENLWEGSYTPTLPNGKRHKYNVYAKTQDECEIKLQELIARIKEEIATERRQLQEQTM